MSDQDRHFMRVALSLGRRGLGRVWPWPSVGCVMVKDGRVVGRGVSDPDRVMHAETVALEQAGARARGATAYVTLEPCAHVGRTPPCAEALVAAGVARVVAPLQDPNPQVAGQGFAILRAAGIQVDVGLLADDAERDHQGFLLRQRQGRPMLTLKLASSFDGRIATASGESQWITGVQARTQVHALRAQHDAVLIGAGTARADDPALTVRGLGVRHQPVRVVASRHLDLPLNSQLAQSATEVPLWLCCAASADARLRQTWTEIGAKVLDVPIGPDGQISLKGLMQVLGANDMTRVFCEGGGTFASALLMADHVDVLVGYTAGLTLGAEGRPSLGAMGIDALAAAPRFALDQLSTLGEDVLHIWRRS